MVSAGNLGLFDAAQRFDSKHGVKFSSFAEPRIRGAILDSLRMADSLSRDMRRMSNALREARERLAQQLGHQPSRAEMAVEMAMTVDQLDAAERKSMAGAVVSSYDDCGPDFLNTVADKADDSLEIAIRRQMAANLEVAIRGLPRQMQIALSLYFADDLNLKEVGKVMGVTESRVCQIVHAAVRLLQERLPQGTEGAA